MHLIDIKTLKEFWKKHPEAEAALTRWYQIAEISVWNNLREVRDVFPQADLAKVKSGHVVTIFNIAGNNYRLITAIHYNTKRVYLMMVLTHREYDSGRWKEIL